MQNLSSITGPLRRAAIRYRVLLFGLLAVLAAAPAAFAQTGSVGIGTTAPDASAALDIVSTSKGALLPRVALASGIASPATGLLVFQTGGTSGFYYNAGTAAAPNWQQIATAAGATVTASNGLTKTGQNVALGGTLTQATTIAQAGFALGYTGGHVGVGIAAPTSKLHVGLANDGEQGLRVSDGTATSNIVIQPLTGGNSGFATLNYNGYFNGSEQRDNAAKNRWRVGVDQRGTADLFFVDTFNGTAGTTPLAILPNGNVGLGTTTPTQKLDVVGNVQVPAANAYRYASPKSYSLSVAAADFQPETSATTKEIFDQGNSNLFYANNAGGALRAPLHLPQGATITGFVLRYADNSAADLTVTLRNQSNFVTSTTLGTFTSTGASSLFQDSATPVTAVVNNNNSHYYLRATFGAVFVQLSIVSVEVTYTVTQAE